ncbi:uncharacterized protein LOC120345195 isoform X1 [Styela clava]
MSLDTELIVTMPPWKREFMEKKRKKEKMEELKVPLWKRELLKRIHSKNQRMNEDQTDILEEHIPKVSDNIFLVHEKQHRPKYSSTPPNKSLSPEIATTNPINITSVDNIIIIENEDKSVNNEVTSNNNSESVFATDETKEYPKVGIVHKLLGRFQTDKSDQQQKTKTYHIPTYQRSKSSEVVKSPTTLTHIEPYPTVIVEKKTQNLESQDTVKSTMPTDMLSPLLISSAKPFSKQAMSSTDHGFHHVNVPIRKVSAPTSPKHVVSPTKTEPAASKPDVSNEIETKNKDTSSFNDDLSKLHSAREDNTNFVRTTVKTEPQHAPYSVTSLKKHTDLKNGETLHSSGSTVEQTSNAKEIQKPKLQDKSNFTSYRQGAKTQANEAHKPENMQTIPKYEPPKKEIIIKPSVESQKPKVQIKPSTMKENNSSVQSHPPYVKKYGKGENEFMKIVHESLDESTLKSKLAIKANKLMMTSKTLKITPSRARKQFPQNEPELATATPTKTMTKVSTASEKNHKPIPAKRLSVEKEIHIMENKESTPEPTKSWVTNQPRDELPSQELVKSHTKAPPLQEPVKPWVKSPTQYDLPSPEPVNKSWVKDSPKKDLPSQEPVGGYVKAPPEGDLPSTSIDDILNETNLVITPVASLPISPTEPRKDIVIFKEEKKKSIATIPSPSNSNDIHKPSTMFTNRTNSNTISVIPKTESVQKPASFGSRFPSSTSGSSRGKSFTIDPSKFRKSAAAPVPPPTNIVKGSGNTRMIVPGNKPNVAETDSIESAKSGKRKLTVDQITVIGGYISLERSCLIKNTKRKKSVSSISFCEDKDLEKTFTYASERSLLALETKATVNTVTKAPGFGKDSTIGKYTPKYLLSMKSEELDDEDTSDSKSVSTTSSEKEIATSNDATPDDNAATWDDVTNSSSTTDILF